MSNIPCQLVIRSEDTILLPPKMLFVVCRELFRFGVKNMVKKNSHVILTLTYTPKSETVARKLGNLPVKYIRLSTEDEAEIELFETAMHRFNFNLKEEDVAETKKRLREEEEEEEEELEQQKQQQPRKKIKLLRPAKEIQSAEEEEEEELEQQHQQTKRKIKLLENRIIRPAREIHQASSSSSRPKEISQASSACPELVEIYSDDADNFCAQKYTYEY